MIAGKAVKRKGTPQNRIQGLFVLGSFKGGRKVKRVIWKGITFNFPTRCFLQHEGGRKHLSALL